MKRIPLLILLATFSAAGLSVGQNPPPTPRSRASVLVPTPRSAAPNPEAVRYPAPAAPTPATPAAPPAPTVVPTPATTATPAAPPTAASTPVPVESTSAPVPSDAPAIPRATAVRGEEPSALNFPANPPSDLIDHYEQLTGVRLIRDANLQGPALKLITNHRVTPREAARLIEATLLLNGFAFVPSGENTMKVINFGGGKSPRSEAVTLLAPPDPIPDSDEVVSYFVPLSYISTDEALPILQAHAQLHPYGSIVAVPNSQALVITENARLVSRLIGLKDLIDKKPARIETVFVKLERANAERVATLITELIEKRKATQRPGAAPAPGQPAAAAGASAEAGTALNDAQVMADTRTNRVMVVCRKQNIEYLVKLVHDLDAAVDLQDPYERPLRYVPAAEVLPVLSDLLTEDETTQPKGSAGSPQANQQNQNQRNRSLTGQGNTAGGLGRTGSAGGAGRGAQVVLGDQAQDTAPQSLIVGKTTLIADNRANSILVLGPPESREKVAALLDRLDKRPMQVYLSCVIGQFTLKNDRETAVDVLQKYQTDGTNGIASSIINPITRGDTGLDPRALLNATLFPRLSGLTVYGTVNDILNVYVKALESTDRFRVLSRPSVYTANNKKAVIFSGQKVAIPVSTSSEIVNSGTTNAASTALNSNIQYQDVVLKLEVLPLINSEREVTLQIDQQNDSIIGTQIISGNTVPTIGTQNLNTTVTIQNRGTIVLGGLITETKDRSLSGVPGLMNLPLVGYLFRNTHDKKERSELLVLIQPTVVETPSETIEASNDEQVRTKVGQYIQRSEFRENPTPSPPPFKRF